MKLVQAASPLAPRRQVLVLASRFWAWLFLLVLIFFFALTGPGFFTFDNFQSLIFNMAPMLLMALGQTFVIISAGIDLSTGFVMGLAAVIAAQVMVWLNGHVPLPLLLIMSISVGLVVGVLPGLLNGLVVARLKIPPFIATLGMYGIARGAGFLLSGGLPISVQINSIGNLGNASLLYYHPAAGFSFFTPPVLPDTARARDLISLLPLQVIIVIVVLLACHWLLSRTRFGKHTYALGGSFEAARRAGIPVNRHLVKIYALSALLTAVAGVLYVLRYTSGAADAGDALMLDSIAAVVIGGASLFGGEGTIVGTLIGALIIAILNNGLVIVGVEGYWQFIAVGVVIILAVVIDQAKARLAR